MGLKHKVLLEVVDSALNGESTCLLSQFLCSLAHPLSRTLQAGLVYSRFQERGQVMVSAGLHALIVVCLVKRGIIAPIDDVWNCVESSSCVLVRPCVVICPCVLSQGQGSCTIAVLVMSLSSFLLVHRFLSLCTGLLTLVLYCHLWRSFLYLCVFGYSTFGNPLDELRANCAILYS